MIDPTPSRTQLLENIRRCLAPAANVSPHEGPDRRQQYGEIQRNYRRNTELDSAGRIHLFEERVREYDAVVHRVSASNIADAVAEPLQIRSKKRLVRPETLPKEWLPSMFTLAAADPFFDSRTRRLRRGRDGLHRGDCAHGYYRSTECADSGSAPTYLDPRLSSLRSIRGTDCGDGSGSA